MRRRWLGCVVLWAAVAAGVQLPPDAEVTEIHPGAWRFRLRRPGPQVIDGVLWERRQERLTLVPTIGGEVLCGVEPTSRQAARLETPEQRAVAAVNADFFDNEGVIQGSTINPFVRERELLQPGAGGAAFCVLEDGSWRIANLTCRLTVELADRALRLARLNNERGPDQLILLTPAWGPTTRTNAFGVEVALTGPPRLPLNGRLTYTVAAPPQIAVGNAVIPAEGVVLSGHGRGAEALRGLLPGQTVSLSVETRPELPVVHALGGQPVLLAGGRLVYQAKLIEPRHPRTALGYDDTHGVMVTVDGRRPGHSIGQTLPELGALLLGLGCREGLNFDGGGSTTLWVRGEVINRPSDGTERRVANALALLTRTPLGPPARVVFDPPGPVWLTPGARLPVTARAVDQWLNPLPRAAVSLTASGGVGQLLGEIFVAERPGPGTIVAAGGPAAGLAVTVVDRLAGLRVEPASLALLPGERVILNVSGLTAEGQRVEVAPEAVGWSLDGALGRLDRTTFIAGAAGQTGRLVASAFGARVEVPVTIAAPTLVEGFEAGLPVRFEGRPATVVGSVERLLDRPAEGLAYCRLTYDLGRETVTRAAYVKLNRSLGAARAVQAQVRGDGQRVWLRALLRDGDGVALTRDLFDGVLPDEWVRVQALLPADVKPPVVWDSVYLVTLASGTTTVGRVDWDELSVVR